MWLSPALCTCVLFNHRPEAQGDLVAAQSTTSHVGICITVACRVGERERMLCLASRLMSWSAPVPAGGAHCKVLLPGNPQESVSVQSGPAGQMHITFTEHPCQVHCLPVPRPYPERSSVHAPFARDFQRPESQRQVVKILTLALGKVKEIVQGNLICGHPRLLSHLSCDQEHELREKI